jgi:cyclophilin family peptidyl-prolyl cis-trans isomerase/protein-disulfide isomerase
MPYSPRSPNLKEDTPTVTRLTLAVLLFALALSACTGTPSGYPDFSATEAALINLMPPTARPNSCQTIPFAPTPGPDAVSLFPTRLESDRLWGREDAPVTITIYNDFSCPQCAPLALTLVQLAQAHPNDLQLVFRHFPLLSVFDKSGLAAQATEAAALQAKFWEMHNLLYETQAEWLEIPPEDFPAWLAERAASLGLDSAQFAADLTSEYTAQRAQQAWDDGRAIGLPGAPFMLINGQIHAGPADFNALDAITRLIALGARQFETCPLLVIAPARQYFATLETEYGEVVIQLFADKAPAAVNNFVFLAQAGWYDNITFHRVVPGYIIQTGDPSGTGQGNPGYFMDTEYPSGLAFDRPGMVAMANAGPNTNGSQFFITLAPIPQLNDNYTIFGQVIRGLDVLQSLRARDPVPGEFLPPGDTLISIRIEER